MPKGNRPSTHTFFMWIFHWIVVCGRHRFMTSSSFPFSSLSAFPHRSRRHGGDGDGGGGCCRRHGRRPRPQLFIRHRFALYVFALLAHCYKMTFFRLEMFTWFVMLLVWSHYLIFCAVCYGRLCGDDETCLRCLFEYFSRSLANRCCFILSCSVLAQHHHCRRLSPTVPHPLPFAMNVWYPSAVQVHVGRPPPSPLLSEWAAILAHMKMSSFLLQWTFRPLFSGRCRIWNNERWRPLEIMMFYS